MPVLTDRAARGTGDSVPREVRPRTAPATAVARRVLVADPCPDTVETTALLLQLWGHDVRAAAGGPEVLEVARGYRPDTVLMEIGLPELDGWEVARRLRRQVGGAGLLLVAVTGYGGDKYCRQSRESGFDYHLVKPVDPETLQELLATRQREPGGR